MFEDDLSRAVQLHLTEPFGDQAARSSACHRQVSFVANTGVVRSQNNAKDFCDTVKANGLLVGGLLVHKQIIRGVHANQDTQVLATGDPLKRSFNLRAWFKYAPWLIGAAAVAWFFRRRNNVAKLQDSKNTGSEE